MPGLGGDSRVFGASSPVFVPGLGDDSLDSVACSSAFLPGQGGHSLLSGARYPAFVPVPVGDSLAFGSSLELFSQTCAFVVCRKTSFFGLSFMRAFLVSIVSSTTNAYTTSIHMSPGHLQWDRAGTRPGTWRGAGSSVALGPGPLREAGAHVRCMHVVCVYA